MRIYISGQITGIPDGNRGAFRDAAEALQLRYPEASIVNPHNNGLPAGATWNEHMRADIKLLMDCDSLALLPGWEKSRGAPIELKLARNIGIYVGRLDYWLEAE